jgi:hypothetical protein
MKSAFFRAALVAGVALLLSSGCSVEHHVTGPLPVRRPVANSPGNAIRVFEWGWNHRNQDSFRHVLAGDFQFVFALGDSAGQLFPGARIGRDELLEILGYMFVGGGPTPRATSVVLLLDPTLRVLPDSRLGKDPAWHKEILSAVDFTLRTEDGAEYRLAGNARFFVVRGDSAVIPADLVTEGVVPDSTRWYIDQWHDETLQGAGLRASPADLQAPLPARNSTWGQILALYRPPPVLARR